MIFQNKIHFFSSLRLSQSKQMVSKGPFLYYVLGHRGGYLGGPENGNFPLLYVVKMSLRRWVGGSKKPQNTQYVI